MCVGTRKLLLDFASDSLVDHEDQKTENLNFTALFIVYHRKQPHTLAALACSTLEPLIVDDVTVHPTINM